MPSRDIVSWCVSIEPYQTRCLFDSLYMWVWWLPPPWGWWGYYRNHEVQREIIFVHDSNEDSSTGKSYSKHFRKVPWIFTHKNNLLQQEIWDIQTYHVRYSSILSFGFEVIKFCFWEKRPMHFFQAFFPRPVLIAPNNNHCSNKLGPKGQCLLFQITNVQTNWAQKATGQSIPCPSSPKPTPGL